MSGIDRSKFKKTSASQLVQSDKDLNKTMGRKERTNNNGHAIDDGTNLFRFYPVHPEIAELDPKSVFAQPFVQTFLPAMVQEKKDGQTIMENGKPKLKLSVRPVYNSKVHGGTPKDLVEEFITLANKNAKDRGLSEDQRKEYVKPIYGFFSKDPKKNVNGINYTQMWIIYADKYPNANAAATPVFDELRIKKGVKERLNKISAIESSNDPLGTDPFTDLEEGKAVKIMYDPNSETPQGYYTTELDTTTENQIIAGKSYKMPKLYPLTDEQLINFLDQEPLYIKYGKKLANRKNFENQLTGLEMLDTREKMGIFALPEWEKIIQECDSYYPETGTEGTADIEQNDTTSTDEDTTTDDNSDEFDLLDRAELQAYCRDNKTGILVKPSLSDDEIRIKLRAWKENDTPIDHVPLPGDADYIESEKVVVVAEEKVKETAQDRQDFIDDLNGKKKEEQPAITGAAVGETAKEKLDRLRRVKANAA